MYEEEVIAPGKSSKLYLTHFNPWNNLECCNNAITAGLEMSILKYSTPNADTNYSNIPAIQTRGVEESYKLRLENPVILTRVAPTT